LLFNDVGSTNGSIKINTAITKPQQFTFGTQIRETRSISGKFWGKRKGVFEITLEAIVLDTIKYVPDLDIDKARGFLMVTLKDDKSKKSLPAYLKVKVEGVDAKKEHITILEGPYHGKSASVDLGDDGSSWLIANVKHKPMIRAKYSISKKIFILKGKKYKAVDYPPAPWKKGVYDIAIPDYPHRGGRNYLNQSKRAMTWFKISYGNERYLHIGDGSLGCMTLIEKKRWMEIYDILIKARKGDFMSIGVVEIID
ncbi:MAG: hypothetical protein HQ539_00020, partial [Parcubacteria group bacterium]|nr:hypothetical protein [Parcubacteria group bacterium]